MVNGVAEPVNGRVESVFSRIDVKRYLFCPVSEVRLQKLFLQLRVFSEGTPEVHIGTEDPALNSVRLPVNDNSADRFKLQYGFNFAWEKRSRPRNAERPSWIDRSRVMV
jgi:hypothetical protein